MALSLELTVKKEKWRANFGRALASIGDIDLDGYQGMIDECDIADVVSCHLLPFKSQLCLENGTRLVCCKGCGVLMELYQVDELLGIIVA